MTDKEQMEFALRFTESGRNVDDIWHHDDLCEATDEETEQCAEYAYECRTIGTAEFKKRVEEVRNDNS